MNKHALGHAWARFNGPLWAALIDAGWEQVAYVDDWALLRPRSAQ